MHGSAKGTRAGHPGVGLLAVAHLKDEEDTAYSFKAGRGGFLQVARGWINLNGEDLKEGDGAEISDVDTITIKAKADSEVLLFDLA